MKKYILLLISTFGLLSIYSQTNPQYEFYSNYDISSLTGGVKNCVEEVDCIEYALKLYDILKSDSLSDADNFMAALYASLIYRVNKGEIEFMSDIEPILTKVANLNDRQRIDMITRLYEIENTCYITYKTVDGEKLKFKVAEEENNSNPADLIPVNFGAPLISNEYSSDYTYTLKFSKPITRIDANLFAENVEYIKLPRNSSLIYTNNSTKNISNLYRIEGRDVMNNVLIRDSVLIVAAVAELSHFSVPSFVKVIGEDGFRGCKLRTINIPESVSSIGNNAFCDCTNLSDVVLNCNCVITIGKNAFDEKNGSKFKIHMPKNILKQYKKKYPFLKKRLVGY